VAHYTPASSFLSAGRFGEDRWANALIERGADIPWEIAANYHDLAPDLGLNPDLALAQAVEETGWFKSELWLTRRNACGLGITGPGVLGLDYGSPQRGIMAHLAHLCCYVHTAESCPVRGEHGSARPGGDPRHWFHDGNPALSHLQEPKPGRRWAEGPDYVAHILAILAVVGRGLPETGGSTVAVSKPPVNTKHPSPNRGYAADVHRVDAVIWHITQGTNSLGWLTNPASGASSNYLIARNGTIYELVPPTESAWANGRVCNPDADHNQPLITKWVKEGVNFNRRSVSIEHEGMTSVGKGGSLTKAQVEATVNLTAWLCQEFKLTPDRAHIFGHFEIDACDRPNCPGFSEAEWGDWVGRVAGLLKGTPPSAMLEPVVTPARDWGGKGRLIAQTVTVVNDDTGAYYEGKTEYRAEGPVQLPWREV